MSITPEQCRAGRALAKIEVNMLALEAGADLGAIKAFESGAPAGDGRLAGTLRHALESLGAEFLPEENGKGVGVRLKFDRAGARQIGRWETEGGPVADDDVP